MKGAIMETSDLIPGTVLLAPADFDTGHPSRLYVLLSDPTAPAVQLCPAGEDEDGELCETAETVYVDRDSLAEWEPVEGPLLPWPKERPSTEEGDIMLAKLLSFGGPWPMAD